MKAFSALLAICAGNSPVTRQFPTQRLMTWNFDVFFDRCLNKRLSKQSWGWWFETPLWRQCNGEKGHDNALAWKRFPQYCPFVRGIHRSPGDSPHKGLLMQSFDSFFVVKLKQVTQQTVDLPVIQEALGGNRFFFNLSPFYKRPLTNVTWNYSMDK